MWLSLIIKLGLHIQKTNINTQKIDDSKLNIFDIVITICLINDKNKKSRFFEKLFLLTDISIDITFGIFFFTLNNTQINFNN